MANHHKNRIRKNFLKGQEVRVTEHALDMFYERTESELGRDSAIKLIKRKFKNSTLRKFFKSGKELRAEVAGSMDERLSFISIKEKNQFVIISCWLQGRKDDWWKNEGVKRKCQDESVENQFQL